MTHTAAQDSVLRLAAGMMAADVRYVLPPEMRQWVIDRLQDQGVLSGAERAALCDPLLTYIAAYHPRVLAIVSRQFAETGVEEGPQGVATPQRPSTHYGLVPGRTQA